MPHEPPDEGTTPTPKLPAWMNQVSKGFALLEELAAEYQPVLDLGDDTPHDHPRSDVLWERSFEDALEVLIEAESIDDDVEKRAAYAEVVGKPIDETLESIRRRKGNLRPAGVAFAVLGPRAVAAGGNSPARVTSDAPRAPPRRDDERVEQRDSPPAASDSEPPRLRLAPKPGAIYTFAVLTADDRGEVVSR